MQFEQICNKYFNHKVFGHQHTLKWLHKSDFWLLWAYFHGPSETNSFTLSHISQYYINTAAGSHTHFTPTHHYHSRQITNAHSCPSGFLPLSLSFFPPINTNHTELLFRNRRKHCTPGTQPYLVLYWRHSCPIYSRENCSQSVNVMDFQRKLLSF